MLREIKNVKQLPGESKRRWFYDDGIDLILWEDKKDMIVGFQLTYDKPQNPHILTWTEKAGFQHNRLDDGEHAEGMKDAPILLSDGIFDFSRIAADFKRVWPNHDHLVFDFVYKKLMRYA